MTASGRRCSCTRSPRCARSCCRPSKSRPPGTSSRSGERSEGSPRTWSPTHARSAGVDVVDPSPGDDLTDLAGTYQPSCTSSDDRAPKRSSRSVGRTPTCSTVTTTTRRCERARPDPSGIPRRVPARRAPRRRLAVRRPRQYYPPEALPADGVHPYTYERGVSPDSGGVVESGFDGAGEFAFARRGRAPQRGADGGRGLPVTTRGSLWARVPCLFGLGVLFDADAPYADELALRLAWCDENPLLARLEENRLALYLRIHDVLRDLEGVAEERDQARAALDQVRAAVHALADSRTIRAIDAVQRPTRVLRSDRPGVRRLLHEIADDPL